MEENIRACYASDPSRYRSTIPPCLLRPAIRFVRNSAGCRNSRACTKLSKIQNHKVWESLKFKRRSGAILAKMEAKSMR